MRAVSSRLMLLGPIVAAALAGGTPAQSEQADPRASESSGIQATIGEITIKDSSHLAVQLLLKNTTKSRKYVILWRDKGSLSNGDELNLVRAAGIKDCSSSSKENCAQSTIDPNYIEPGQTISAAIWFHDNDGKVTATSRLSFPLRLVVRTVPTTDDVLASAPAKPASPPELVVISFTEVALPN